MFHARNNYWTNSSLSDARDALVAAGIGDHALFGGGGDAQTFTAYDPTLDADFVVVDFFDVNTRRWNSGTVLG